MTSRQVTKPVLSSVDRLRICRKAARNARTGFRRHPGSSAERGTRSGQRGGSSRIGGAPPDGVRAGGWPVIGKITAPRGERVEPLIYYLYGPGRHEEHTDPHIVAGWRHPAELEPPLRADGTRDFRKLLGLLKQPHAALGKCGVRPAGVALLDARRPRGQDAQRRRVGADRARRDAPHRAVPVRGGRRRRCAGSRSGTAGDHVHIVAMLARQDRPGPACTTSGTGSGTPAWPPSSGTGCGPTAPGGPDRAPLPQPGEKEKATRRGLAEAPRVTLRRQVTTAAAASASATGVLRPAGPGRGAGPPAVQHEEPGQVTGYAVALPGDTGADGGPVWYGGGKLAADLTWPRLCQRWTGPARPG